MLRGKPISREELDNTVNELKTIKEVMTCITGGTVPVVVDENPSGDGDHITNMLNMAIGLGLSNDDYDQMIRFVKNRKEKGKIVQPLETSMLTDGVDKKLDWENEEIVTIDSLPIDTPTTVEGKIGKVAISGKGIDKTITSSVLQTITEQRELNLVEANSASTEFDNSHMIHDPLDDPYCLNQIELTDIKELYDESVSKPKHRGKYTKKKYRYKKKVGKRR